MITSEAFFYSDGVRIAGYLNTPDDWKPEDVPRPAVVVLAGYSGHTQADCAHMMARLCSEGWFVFSFDYVGFGNSEGRRNRHRPLEQAQNAYDALSYVQTIPGVDPERLGVYGTSFGGANGVWVAAHDERVKCLVTSVGVTHGERWMRIIRRPWEWLAFKEQLLKEAQQRVRTGMSTLVRHDEVAIRDPDSQRHREMQRAHGHTFQSVERDLESYEAVLRYRPEWVVDKISPRPVLMIYAQYDNLVPPEEQLSCFAKCGEPKKLVMLPKAGHYDSYEFRNTPSYKIVYAETTAWFKRYL